MNISELIKERMPSLSKGQKRIAEAILNDYDKAAYMTAARLSASVGVSESTVVRFAIELGFKGYPEFQAAVQELVRTKLTPNQRIAVTDARIGTGDVLAKVLNADIDRIRGTLENIDREAFNAATDAMVTARNIYIAGARSAAALATFLNFNLSMICDNVRFLQPTSSSEVFEQILDIDEQDVIIAISFPRYSTKIINAIKYAKSRGATVVVLTDSNLSPIAEYATHLLTAQSDMASFVDSLVAPLSVIDALLVSLTQKKREDIIRRFEWLENVWDEYNVYAKQ